MKRFIVLVFIALIVIALLLFVFNPQLLEKIWLWIVGLIGMIISAIRNAINGVIGFFKDEEGSNKSSSSKNDQLRSPAHTVGAPIIATGTTDHSVVAGYQNRVSELEGQIAVMQEELKKAKSIDNFRGTTLTVLRYFDDKKTTLGLLFLEDDFFCYTLEDTYRQEKIMEETRIPQGTYKLGFNEFDTNLTKKYRETRPWFKYHLHVKDVPNYKGVYIHVGNTIKDTAGCLLVADSIESSNARRAIFNSREAFKRLYLELRPVIESGKRVRIRYFDEDWFSRFELKRIVA